MFLSPLRTTSGIFILRAYAIYGRSRVVFVLLAIPGLALVASGIVCFLFPFPSGLADIYFQWIQATQSPFALPLQLQLATNDCWFNVDSSFNAGFVSLGKFTQT